jgi:hypothetical protein
MLYTKAEVYDKARDVVNSCTSLTNLESASRYVEYAATVVADKEVKEEEEMFGPHHGGPLNTEWSENIKDLRFELLVGKVNMQLKQRQLNKETHENI